MTDQKKTTRKGKRAPSKKRKNGPTKRASSAHELPEVSGSTIPKEQALTEPAPAIDAGPAPEAPPSPPDVAEDRPQAPLTATAARHTPMVFPALTKHVRDVIGEAAYLEALDRGDSKRDALRYSEAIADRLRLEGPGGPGGTPSYGPGFYDLRHEQDYDYPRGAHKVRMHGAAPVRRDPSTIDTVVLHQAAVEFGVSQRAIRLAGGDVELARARRALDVACHAMAFRQGYFVAAHNLLDYVNHAGRLNAPSLCLEVDGRYPGLLDDPATLAREDLATTWGGDPTDLTDATIQATRDALAWLVDEGRMIGCPITKLAPHRISSDTRRSDPGEELWQTVAVDFGQAELGLTLQRESRWAVGRPVPVQWDVDGIGNY